MHCACSYGAGNASGLLSRIPRANLVYVNFEQVDIRVMLKTISDITGINFVVGAKIAAQSGVTKDIPAGRAVAGFPAIDARQYWRKVAALGRLAQSGKDN